MIVFMKHERSENPKISCPTPLLEQEEFLLPFTLSAISLKQGERNIIFTFGPPYLGAYNDHPPQGIRFFSLLLSMNNLPVMANGVPFLCVGCQFKTILN